ncbi:MAG: tautomerase family protein [Nocardioides sp.]|uniref:tautomerase family protein n=1 Tax=Nocardioides sp. TaxID=35761 RepID=UPI0039E51EC8
MPQVELSIRAGRDAETIRTLIGAVTEAVSSTLVVNRSSVRVIVHEIPATHWANGGMTLFERDDIPQLAARLGEATAAGTEIARLSTEVAMTLADAYAIQLAGLDLRVAAGEVPVGLKLGFTSKEKAAQMGVDDVILGVLTSTMLIDDGGTLDTSALIHPRVEPEVAFRFAEDAGGLDLTDPDTDLLAHVTHLAPALEVIDSRYRDFSFTLADVVADNASASRYVIGPWKPLDAVRDRIGDRQVWLRVDDTVAATGSTRAILNDPLAAVPAATRLAARYGHPLPGGAVLLAGAATAAVPLPESGRVSAEVEGLGTVSMTTHRTATD